MASKWDVTKHLVILSEAEINDDDSWGEQYDFICSAFTVAELGEILPVEIELEKEIIIPRIWRY